MNKITKSDQEYVNIYALYDSGFKEYCAIATLRDFEVIPYFRELASDVKSPYFQRIKDFEVYKLGSLFTENGNIYSYVEHVNSLLFYLDDKRVEYQRIVQTLNFLPNGYFKMPAEMQKSIQDKIATAVKDYVEKFADVDKLYEKLSDSDSTLLKEPELTE